MAKYHVYGIGAALVDTEIEVTDYDLQQLQVKKGLMTLVDEARQTELINYLQDNITASKRASGGSAANTIIAVCAFGGHTFYSCKVANDNNGQFYLKDLANAGVDYNHNNEPTEGFTGKCLVLITPDAERSMNTFLGVSETISIQNLNPQALCESDYLYIEGYLVTSNTGRAAAIRAREIAEEHQVKTALSLSDPGMVSFFKDGLKEMLGDGVDLLFCNEAEALGWTDSHSLDVATTKLKQSAKTFAVTLGSRGTIIFDGQQLFKIPGQPTTAVDTNGAGDMFAGAFLYAITHGYNYQQAGVFANVAAAKIVSQFGPRLDPEQYSALRHSHDF